MRRYGWGISGLIHLLLAALFFLITVELPSGPEEYALVEFGQLPEVPPVIDTPREAPVEPEPEPETEPVETPPEAVAPPEPEQRSSIGVRGIPDWVTGPPGASLPPIEVPERTDAALGPLRRAVAEGRSARWIAGPGATIVDTLLYAQERLVELADSIMDAARTGPRPDRFGSPIVEPGTIEDLRGEPFLPLTGVAAALISQLAEIAREAWNRLIGRDPDALPEPDMDLTVAQVMAYAALDDRFALTIFEWHARLDSRFEGGLTALQQLAAGLAERGLCRPEMDGNTFTYQRTIPLRQVVQYYVTFLSRLPETEPELRAELIEKISILVREPVYR